MPFSKSSESEIYILNNIISKYQLLAKGPALPRNFFFYFSPFGPAVWPTIGIRQHIYKYLVLLYRFGVDY